MMTDLAELLIKATRVHLLGPLPPIGKTAMPNYETAGEVYTSTEDAVTVKHEQLNRAICEIDEVIAHLESLLARIHGQPLDKPKPEVAVEVPTLCLAHLLENGANEIRSRCKQTHEIIHNIESALF